MEFSIYIVYIIVYKLIGWFCGYDVITLYGNIHSIQRLLWDLQ